MTVAVAVVSWNTRELLVRCLHSLYGDVEAGRAEVWVVDNGSQDGSVAAARACGPWVHLLTPQENLGFGRAVNLVARRTATTWLLAANADIALEPDALTAMLEAGDDPQVGCVAPRLVLPSDTTQHSVHPFPTVPFTLAFNLGLQRLSHSFGERACLEGWWDSERPRLVPWAIGACLLLRRRAFDDVGGFDERQWMYAEDLDLGWRLNESGWRTRYEPRAVVRHESGAATAPVFGEDRATRFMAETYVWLIRRRGPLRAGLTALLNIFGAAGRAIWMAPAARVTSRLSGAERDNRRWLAAHVKGMMACYRQRPWQRSAS